MTNTTSFASYDALPLEPLEQAWQSKELDTRAWDLVLAERQGCEHTDAWLRDKLRQALSAEATADLGQGEGVREEHDSAHAQRADAAQRAQGIWRQWRALHMWHPPQQSQRTGMLLALPAWGLLPSDAVSLAPELQASLSAWALKRGLVLRVGAPCSASAWHEKTPQALHAYQQVHQESAPVTVGAAYRGPWLWPLWAQTEGTESQQLTSFVSAVPQKDPELVRVLMRMESLLESLSTPLLDSTASPLRLLGPTAGWNADSVARLSWARAQVLVAGAGWLLSHAQGTQWSLCRIGQPDACEKQLLCELSFDTETRRDVSQALLSANRALGPSAQRAKSSAL